MITRYLLILGFEPFYISAEASFRLVQDTRVARVHLRPTPTLLVEQNDRFTSFHSFACFRNHESGVLP